MLESLFQGSRRLGLQRSGQLRPHSVLRIEYRRHIFLNRLHRGKIFCSVFGSTFHHLLPSGQDLQCKQQGYATVGQRNKVSPLRHLFRSHNG